MFLKKLLILVFLSGFSTILLAEDQQYDYLTYTINAYNNSGVDVKTNAVSTNTDLSSVILKFSDFDIADQKTGQLAIADATSAVADPAGGPSWVYTIYVHDKPLCKIKVISNAKGVNFLQTTTTVDPDGALFCKLSCATSGNCNCSTSSSCNDVYRQGTSKAEPYTATYNLTIAKP